MLPGSATTGIYLGVTSAADSNLLHDYEEGELSNPLYFGNTSTINKRDIQVVETL